MAYAKLRGNRGWRAGVVAFAGTSQPQHRFRKYRRKMQRKSISKRARFEVFKRDFFSCQYCGAHPPAVKLEIDHITAVANGGLNDTDNLVTACEGCNRGKSSVPLEAIPQSLRDKARETLEREEQLRGYHAIFEAKYQRLEADTWRVVDAFIGFFNQDSIRKDWFSSTRRFVDELGVHECLGAMNAALARRPDSKDWAFRYFCGTCWRKIRGDNAAH